MTPVFLVNWNVLVTVGNNSKSLWRLLGGDGRLWDETKYHGLSSLNLSGNPTKSI